MLKLILMLKKRLRIPPKYIFFNETTQLNEQTKNSTRSFKIIFEKK